MTKFDLSENKITSILPTELGRLTFLAHFNLGRNTVWGTLPTQIGGMTSLASGLGPHSNRFRGSIVTEIGMLKFMEEDFRLNANAFTGTFRPRWGS